MKLRGKKNALVQVAKYVALVSRTLTPRRRSALKGALLAMQKLYGRGRR